MGKIVGRAGTGRLAATAALWCLLTAQSYGPGDLDESFDRQVITIAAASLACYRIDAWIATTPTQQRRGLMFVRDLPQQHGMVFIYPEAGMRSMWMKNTYIPLDILFFRESGSITNIERHTEPLSLDSVRSIAPVHYVLELNAGETERLGIQPGDRVML